VGASVAENNLGRVLVGHHNSGCGKATSVGQGVVGFKGLLNHAGVKVGSNSEHLTTFKLCYENLKEYGGTY